MASLLAPLAAPHPAVLASQHLLPALRSFWPTFQDHFTRFSGPSGGSAWLAVKLYYAQVDPLHTAIWLCVFFSTLVYVTQQITGNASQVDRLWTFLPVIYTAHFTFHQYFASLIAPPSFGGIFSNAPAKGSSANVIPRLALIFGLQVLWSARLTFHAIRRGFFKAGEEDYRWPVLREQLPRWAWELLAFFFIAIAQNILLAMTALPQYMILTSTWHTLNKPAHPADGALTVWDGLLAGATVVNLALEMVSDQQQWTYQNYKRGKDAALRDLPAAKLKTLKSEPDVKRGFLTRGLWAYSRHPNFFFEQINWWYFWAFVVVTFSPASKTVGSLLAGKAPTSTIPWADLLQSYATLSPVLMNLLFISSTSFTEYISSGKYPAYKSYAKRVGMFLPIDTVLRGLYYQFIASSTTRQRIEDDVWGDGPSVKSK